MISKPNLDIFTGTANPELANDVADILGRSPVAPKQKLLERNIKFKSKIMFEDMILL